MADLGVDLEADAAFTAQLARIRTASTLEAELPRTLQAELRPYQQEGFRWLARLSAWGAGAAAPCFKSTRTSSMVSTCMALFPAA